MEMGEDLFVSLVEELCLELCFEMHFSAKIGDMTLDILHGVIPMDHDGDTNNDTTEKETKNQTPKHAVTVTCPVCKENVAGQRFAPHLEKCLNGGKRGGLVGNKKSSSSIGGGLGIGLPYYNVVKKVDHYPQSLVIRVRLKDGIPKRNSIREGAPLSEFISWKEIEQAVATSTQQPVTATEQSSTTTTSRTNVT